MTLTRTSFVALDAQTAANLVAAAADLALILDGEGVVQDVSIDDEELDATLGTPQLNWVGHNWASLLLEPSRPRALSLLEDAAAGRQSRWRHLNHRLHHSGDAEAQDDGAELPMLYTAIPLDRRGRTLLLGRDLRPMSMLQQRLIDAQQSVDRDHSRIRHLELRCRTLLQDSGEPLLVVNAATQKITDANPAAVALFANVPGIVGRLLFDLFEPRDRAALDQVLAGVRAGGPTETRQVRLADAAAEVALTASLFREDAASFVLLRLLAQAGSADPAAPRRAADGQGDAAPEPRHGLEMPRSVDQLTELIGRVALKDLVREATDMIERLCIEAALNKTNDNRASAAELLGLSRQSLYVKLHRYGLGDLADAPG